MSEETVSSKRRRGLPVPPQVSGGHESSEPEEDPSEELPPGQLFGHDSERTPTVPLMHVAEAASAAPPAPPSPPAPPALAVPSVQVISSTPIEAPAQATAPMTSVPETTGLTVPYPIFAGLSRDFDVLQGRIQQLSQMYDHLLDRTMAGRAAPGRAESPAQDVMMRLRAVDEIVQQSLSDLSSSSHGAPDPVALQSLIEYMLGEIRVVTARGG